MAAGGARRWTAWLSWLLLALPVAPVGSRAGGPVDDQAGQAADGNKPPPRLTFSYLLEAGITASTGAPRDNQVFGRLFGNRNGEPVVNQVTVTAERALAPAPGKFDWGGKLQLTAGSDARFLNPTGEFENLFNNRYTVAVVEAYLSLHFPVLTPDGVDLKLGQFVSPQSVETIYPTGNFFYSHSYISNFGVPFQHLGGLVTLHAAKFLDLYGALVRGVNVGLLSDPNDAPSGLAGFTLTLAAGQVVLAGHTSVGPENPRAFRDHPVRKGDNTVGTLDPNADLRYVNNVNLTWKVTGQLTSLTDSAYLRDDGLRAAAYGISETLTFRCNRFLSGGIRGEIFRDHNNEFVLQYAANDDYVNAERGLLRNLSRRTVTAPGVHGATFSAVTVGVNLRPAAHVLIRPELRYDKTLDGKKAYTDSSQSHQFTGGLDVVVTF